MVQDFAFLKLEFPKKPEDLERESSRLLLEGGDAEKDLTLTPEERTIKILEIQELIAEDHQILSCRGHLLFTLTKL